MQLAIFLFTILLLEGCSYGNNEQKREPIDSTSVSTAKAADARYTTLSFPHGEAGLSDVNKRELNELAMKASRDGKPIKEIKVLAWSDKEYPEDTQRPAKKDIILAKERANIIKQYIKDDLNAQESVESYNMAKRPDLISRVLKSDEWDLKEAFEETGATSTRLPNGKISYTKASKALVIIDYVEKEKQ